MRIRKKALLIRTLVACLAAICVLVVLQSFPQPFFASSVQAGNLELYSDHQFSSEDGKRLLERVAVKLSTSPLYSGSQSHLAFICNARWRQRLFFLHNYGVAGVNRYPITTNVFLRDAIIEDNCLIGPQGNRVPGDRTLDYFIAHEITHTLTGQSLGWYDYHVRLPQWVREGYADYVGKGSSFNYDEARRAFLAGSPQMDWAKSGLYWRFHLLVAHLLDK
ncbi:MAG: hypothetical protein ABI882_13150, partial [Acidobacteriota bacterium]